MLANRIFSLSISELYLKSATKIKMFWLEMYAVLVYISG